MSTKPSTTRIYTVLAASRNPPPLTQPSTILCTTRKDRAMQAATNASLNAVFAGAQITEEYAVRRPFKGEEAPPESHTTVYNANEYALFMKHTMDAGRST